MNYEEQLKEKLNTVYNYASKAREKLLDPSNEVEIKITTDIAARVENIVGPIGVSEIIRAMEKNGISREDIAFKIAKEIASGAIVKGTKEALVEQAVRTGTAILTEGVLVAPTEGIAKVKVKNNPDGSDYVAVYYAGPIRSAGGTAVALSVVLADVARRAAGFGDYRVTDTQVERYVEEVNIYEARVAHLQYKAPDNDIRWIVRNCPICVDGEPTEDIEASAYRSIPGVETNRIRGGIPLVISEGIAQKAAKVFKYAKKLSLGWEWLEQIIKIKQKESKIEIKPDDTYLDGLVAGRPVFAYPSTKGGFRIRYGKSRTNGLMARNIHPATMVLLDGFITYGTHMKVERPGKGCVLTPYKDMEGPVVRLKDGSIIRIESAEMASEYLDRIDRILFLGDMLVTYGDFLKSAHPLIPSAWCEEWWQKELEAKGVEHPTIISAESMFSLSKIHDLPLHPKFTYHWHDITPEQLKELVLWVSGAYLVKEKEEIREMILIKSNTKNILEDLLIPHHVVDEKIILDGENATALLLTFGMIKNRNISSNEKFNTIFSKNKTTIEIVSELSGISIKAKTPFYVGGRMGRPEKAKERKMDGSPNVLFPTGSQMRSIMRLYRTVKYREGDKTVALELCRRKCTACSSYTPYLICRVCGNETIQERICQKCKQSVNVEEHCGAKTIAFHQQKVNIIEMIENAKSVSETLPEDIKGVKGLSNPTRVPEYLEKGVLRAKHSVYVFRDGTARFDSTNVPLTHFVPKEIGLSLEKVKELGYTVDYQGEQLTSDEQLIQIKQQDIILSNAGAEYFLHVAAFVDDMLVNFYKIRAFYNISKKDDLIGHLCISLSPHTSAGVLCRIIGFTNAHVGYAHPFLIAARRRNCFHGKEKILVHDGSKFELVTMKELVERNLTDAREQDDFGTEYERVSKLKTFAFNKKTKRFELMNITHVSKHIAPKKLLRLKTKSGRTIIVTLDHSLATRNGEKIAAKEATELLIPWKIEQPAILEKSKISLNEDFFFLLGFYLAGGYTKSLAKKIIKEKFVSELFDKMKIGKNAKTKQIPDLVYSLPKNKIHAFLRGYFSGNGSCSFNSSLEVNVTSVNKWLIDGVSILLNFCGIKHSIYEEQRSIRIYGAEAKKFVEDIGFIGKKHAKATKLLEKLMLKNSQVTTKFDGDIFIDEIVEKEVINNLEDYVYNLTVDKHHTLICSGITSFQCDGDEDSIMFLMDALLNFSRAYLTETRGGTMDTPLVLTPYINPKEIDDEAHCIEFISSYPLEFYHATEKFALPSEVKIRIVKDMLDEHNLSASGDIPTTHVGGDLDKGNVKSTYIELDSIPEKITTQFKLQLKLRAVDMKNAVERLILSHFIPDLYGNLRSFYRQNFRCVSCNKIYRRPPLIGKCVLCRGNLLLTINKGSIEKYLQISRRIVEEYDLPLYLKQRLELIEKEISAVFEDDQAKQMDLTDFV